MRSDPRSGSILVQRLSAMQEPAPVITPFADEAYREYLKDLYIGNECHTDEYGEAYPEKGLSIVSSIADLLDQSDPRYMGFYVSLRDWLATFPESGRYTGADEFVPLASLYFDLLWARGQYPYSETWQEYLNGYHAGNLDEFVAEMNEWQSAHDGPKS